MKTLFILRHMQALPAGELGDIDRKLSPKGAQDAVALGKEMKEKSYQPDLALCSPATRTRMTLEGVSSTLNIPQIEYLKAFYDGRLEDYFTLVQQIASSVQSILMVAHNPVIHSLAAHLAIDDGSAYLGSLMNGYAPGTLSVLECDIDDWSDIRADRNRLIDLMGPDPAL